MEGATQWDEPCMPREKFIKLACGCANFRNHPSEKMRTSRHLPRKDFEVSRDDWCTGTGVNMSRSIDTLCKALMFVHKNLSEIMMLLIDSWCAIRQHDPATPSYVRTAVELRHAISNLRNAVDGVVLWITGGCVVKPIFNLRPCSTFVDWTVDAFGDYINHERVGATPLVEVLQEIRTKTDEINTKIPYIYLAMQQVREEHGNRVQCLVSYAPVITIAGAWQRECGKWSSIDLLTDVLGMGTGFNPVPWVLAHMEYLIDETIPLVDRHSVQCKGRSKALIRAREQALAGEDFE